MLRKMKRMLQLFRFLPVTVLWHKYEWHKYELACAQQHSTDTNLPSDILKNKISFANLLEIFHFAWFYSPMSVIGDVDWLRSNERNSGSALSAQTEYKQRVADDEIDFR